MSFQYQASWLENTNAIPLSQSLLLRSEAFSGNECRGFFAGILPDENKREIIARNLGISPRNDFSMLELIGGECAGAITLLPLETNPPRAAGKSYRPVNDTELESLLAELPKRPLLAGEDGVRLSLAGAQDKIVVHLKDNQISIPLGVAPSTHILKPTTERVKTVVQNEAFCMKLAAEVDIPAATVTTRLAGQTEYLLVERYDRIETSTGELKRIHQEDFCQAMGIAPEIKYQVEGGPTLAQCFSLLRSVSTNPVIDLQRLLEAVIFNTLIGNCDAHGKNFSLLYKEKSCRLAPLYDVLSTEFYPELTTQMAMKIGGEGKAHSLRPEHFEKLATEAGLAKGLITSRVVAVAQRVRDALQDSRQANTVEEQLTERISKRCAQVLERFSD
jgi:serine/threonine-protein kinase HipA